MRKMKKILLGFVILFSIVTTLAGQKKSAQAIQSELRIKKGMPTVYITFDRAGERKPLKQGESSKGVWLRLHNNTRWLLTLSMNGVPKEYGDASLFYDVLSEGKVILEQRCHVCSSNQLGPGASLLFSVPNEYLSKGGAIRVNFSYGWEDPDDVFAGREPKHFVYFYSSNLPPQARENDR